MQIIISHLNTDFDALASLLAAKKLYPNATVVLSDKQDNRVRKFLNIYRDTFEFTQDKDLKWEEVKEIILVDVASLNRIGHFAKDLNEDDLHITVFDHHPEGNGDVKRDAGKVEQVGAAVTLLLEQIKEKDLPMTPFEATLFGLGIYTDTGAFTFENTTERDFAAAQFLMSKGMNLELIQQFSEQSLRPEQQALLDKLFVEAERINIDGIEVILASTYEESFVRDLSTITQKLLEIRGADAVLSVVGMKNNVFLVGRARSERISLIPILKKFGGGGHEHAGSAMIKKAEYEAVYADVKEHINLIFKPAVTAKDIMSSPVKSISPDTSIEEAGQLMYRYGHSGYPVVEGDKLLGLITRRDLDKANHHGLGHAPVKAYMTTNMITIEEDLTLEEIQQVIINHNIGRLPVMRDGKLIGIISRTNIIAAIHQDTIADEMSRESSLKENIKDEMKDLLAEDVYSLLCDIGDLANEEEIPVYLVGGIVRDLFLNVTNDDIDLVVEGDGIYFVNKLHEKYGGSVVTHESFGTATWHHPSGHEIDIASSRLEYYDRPASLPDVETSTLTEDLNRRDFTINAMAIYLNKDKFGKVVDPFSGQLDLNEKKIKVLHNISFVEDPTRILRAIRFESRFNFLMDEQTETLAKHSIDKVKNVSVNRIMNDVKRLLKEGKEAQIIKRLFELHFWEQFGISDEARAKSVTHAERLEKLAKDEVAIGEEGLIFSYFLIPFYNDAVLTEAKDFAVTKSSMKVLKEIELLSSLQIESLTDLADLHKKLKDISREAILFLAASVDENDLLRYYLNKRAKLNSFITGKDLQALGLKPGPLYSDLFLQLDIMSLTEKVTNKAQALEFAEQFVSEKLEK